MGVSSSKHKQTSTSPHPADISIMNPDEQVSRCSAWVLIFFGPMFVSIIAFVSDPRQWCWSGATRRSAGSNEGMNWLSLFNWLIISSIWWNYIARGGCVYHLVTMWLFLPIGELTCDVSMVLHLISIIKLSFFAFNRSYCWWFSSVVLFLNYQSVFVCLKVGPSSNNSFYRYIYMSWSII